VANDMEIRLTFNRLPKLGTEMRAKAGQVVAKTAMDVEAKAKLSMEGIKHGNLYRITRHGQTVTHRASAPGEAPAIDTGALRNSVRAQRKADLEWWVTTNEYAAYLEYGTRRMAPRPFLRPAVEKVTPAFEAAMWQVARGEV
jgi:HK97 gp10 family phage protein